MTTATSPASFARKPPLEQLHQLAFWRALAPQWDLGDGAAAGTAAVAYTGELLAISAAERQLAQQQIRREGYIQAEAAWGTDHQAMAALVRRLDAMAIPPVFAFVYDVFWIPFFQLHHRVAALLGDSYRMLPDCWIWNIDPSQNGAGWAPHRDRDYQTLLPCGSPKIINVWLPLSAATPLTSCMYILPADRDPMYGSSKDHNFMVDLACVRALPAQPGEYLIWNQAVLHWGSRSSPRAEASRVSMAWEFQRLDEPLYNGPCLPQLHWPNFEGRLKLIAQQLLHFGSPGFFAQIDPALLRWAAAINPEQGQRRIQSQLAHRTGNAQPVQAPPAVAGPQPTPARLAFDAAKPVPPKPQVRFDSMIGPG